MVADRQIVNNQGGRIEVELPDYISSEEVEVILMPVAKSDDAPKIFDFSSLYGTLQLHKSSEEIDNWLNDLRNEWERDI
jgi:hypothetical protein